MSFRRRIAGGFISAVALVAAATALSAQSIGPNVNLAGGPRRLEIGPSISVLGDPLRAQQFESTCVFSSRNPLKIFCVSNDHRLVDISGVDSALNSKQIIGDSTIGVFESNNGGITWQSTIMPGTKYDAVPSPIKPFDAMADPYAGSGAAGVIFSSNIAFNRGDNARGVLAVSTWMDLGDKEDEAFWAKLISTKIVDEGSAGQFIDRPFMLVTPPQGTMVTYQVPRGDGQTVAQTVPASPVHIGYTTFVGNDQNIRSKIMYTASYDGGITWGNPVKVSEGYAINQGVQIAQVGAKICLTWRRGESGGASNEGDAIMTSCSADGGKTFPRASQLAALCAADQETAYTRFRVRAVPALVAGASRLYLAYSDVPRNSDGTCSATAGSRVYFTSSDGTSWSPPTPIANHPNAAASQVNPAIAVTGDRIDVMWYDFRNDASHVFGRIVDEFPIINALVPPPLKRHTVDIYATHSTASGWAPAYSVSKYFFGKIKDPKDLDTLGKLGGNPDNLQQLQFNAVNVRLFKKMTVPGMGDYSSVAAETMNPGSQPGTWTRGTEQLGDTYNFYSWTDNRNVKLLPKEDYTKPRPYAAPTLPTTVAGATSLFDPTTTTTICDPQNSYAGTKNQDIYGALKTDGVLAGSFGNNKSTENIDRAFGVFGQNMTAAPKILRFAIGVQPAAAAGDPTRMATFNQPRPFGSFTPQVVLDAGATPGAGVVRTVFVPRQSRSPIRVDVGETTAQAVGSITSASVGAQQYLATVTTPVAHGYANGTNVVIVGAEQDAYNGTHQIVLANGHQFTFTFTAAAAPASPATGSMLVGSADALRLARKVWLNFDPSAPPTLDLPDNVPANMPSVNINNFEVYDIDIGQSVVQDISFPSVKSPGWETPGWETPGWETPGWETPGWETPGWETPGWETPGWETPGWETPGWETSTISDQDVQNGSVRDVRFPVKNNSNSPVAVNLRALVNGAVPADLKFQAVAYRLYTTPAQESCDGRKLTGHPQVLFNIPNLDVSQANFTAPLNSSSPQNGTALLLPGEVIYYNVRVWDTTNRLQNRPHAFTPATLVAAVIRQPLGTVEVPDIQITSPPVELSLSMVTSTLPNGIIGVPYSSQLVAAGGKAPYSWSLTGGSLPAGLTLATSGLISGTPPGPQATSNFTVTVTDSSTPAKTVSRDFSISITEGFGPSASMNVGRIFHTQTRLRDGRVLIAGGRGAGGVVLNSAEIYNPATNTFTAVSALAVARQEHTATLLHDGNVLVAGGFSAANIQLNTAEIFNPATGAFTATGALNVARSQHTATLLPSGGVLVAGGIGSGGAITPTAELYSPGAGVFGFTGNLATARYSHTATALPNGLVLIAGGFGSGLSSIAATELYSPPAGETFGVFLAGATLVTPRHAHQAVLLATGQVLLVGGVSKPPAVAGTTTASAELYDPNSNTSASAGAMNSPRQQFVATLLRDGRVLIAGGQNIALPAATDELKSAEIYNPSGGGSFNVTADLSSARARPAATLLADGTVLVTGGDSNTAGYLATTESFHPNPSDGTLDQQQSLVGTDTSIATFIIGDIQDMAQTVTAGVSGFVTQVDLPAGCASGNSMTVLIQLADGFGGVPSGAALATQAVADGFPLPFGVWFRSFVFSQPVYLSAGTRYGIVMTSAATGGNCGVKPGPVGNPYTQGKGYYRNQSSSGNWAVLPNEGREDLPFKVFVR